MWCLLVEFSGSAFCRPLAPPTVETLLQQAEQQHLADSPRWRKILFIPDRAYASDKTLIQDPRFFLGPRGSDFPATELRATLQAFWENRTIPMDDTTTKSVFCLFPARYRFLQEALQLDTQLPALPACPSLENYRDFSNYDRVSVVFSHYYMNNPSSMFGHSLLRLHRHGSSPTLEKSGQLDDAVNFAAYPNATNPFVYAFRGLAGGFPGRFAKVPYFSKLQEYSNFESRDLWEYELTLTREEIQWMSLVLWEQGHFYSDYYFFDENCSYVLLLLIEAAKPSAHLTGRLPLYTIPADTVRALQEENMIRRRHAKPSNLSRYVAYADHLTPIQRSLLKEQMAGKSVKKAPAVCDTQCQAEVLDAGLELVDFREHLAGSMQPKDYAALREEMLLARAKTGIKSAQKEIPPLSTPPELGHRSAFFLLGGGHHSNGGDYGLFQWRPAFHDVTSASMGYGDGMEIRFFDTQIRYYPQQHQAELNRFTLLRILSMPPDYFLLPSYAWQLDMGLDHPLWCETGNRSCTGGYLQGGVGKRIDIVRSRLMAVAMVGARAGAVETKGGYAGPEMSLSLLLRPLDAIGWMTTVRRFSLYGAQWRVVDTEIESLLRINGFSQWDGEVGMQRNGRKVWDAHLGVLHYF